MRILLLITKAEIGGAQISVSNLARELKMRGHQVVVGFGAGDFLCEELIGSEIPSFRFKNLIRTHNPFFAINFVLELKRYLNGNPFDCLHINSSNALAGSVAAKLSKTKIKTVFTFRGLSLLDPNYEKNRAVGILYRAYFKFFLRFIDCKVFVSQANLDYARHSGIISRSDKSACVISNGLDISALAFHDKEQARNLLSGHIGADLKNKFIIGSVGRHCYAKNYEFLIDLFPHILKINPFTVLIIIGGFSEETAKYQRLIKKLGLADNIFLAGEINNAAKYDSAFDLFTLVSRYEGLPISLIEALSAGLPILAARVGGIPDMLENDEAQLFPLNDGNGFLEKLAAFHADPALFTSLCEKNKELSKHFDIKKTAEGYLEIYVNG